MTEAEKDALTARVFATPDGREWLKLIEPTEPWLHAEITARIRRMRLRWSTGFALTDAPR